MNITVFRIDDRLIHGQIVTAWYSYADATRIVVADDKAAADSFQQSLLKMATPKGIELQVITLDKARALLENEDTKKTLLLTRGPVEALEVLKDTDKIKEINVGNMNMKKGKQKVLDNLWVFPEDIEAFKLLSEKGINLEFRTVPNDTSQSIVKLLKKNNMI